MEIPYVNMYIHMHIDVYIYAMIYIHTYIYICNVYMQLNGQATNYLSHNFVKAISVIAVRYGSDEGARYVCQKK